MCYYVINNPHGRKHNPYERKHNPHERKQNPHERTPNPHERKQTTSERKQNPHERNQNSKLAGVSGTTIVLIKSLLRECALERAGSNLDVWNRILLVSRKEV